MINLESITAGLALTGLDPTGIGSVIAAHTAGRLQEAEAGYRDILRSEPRHFLALNNLGMIALVSGQYKAAVELVDAALAIAPDDARLAPSHRAMGMTLYTQGYWKDAARWLKRARRLAPDDAEVAAACARIAPRDYLAPVVRDAVSGDELLRYASYECATYVYSIEIVGTCNLHCPTCPVSNMAGEQRPKGMMSVDLFRRIVAKIAQEAPVPHPDVWLFNWGEPLLHPQLPDIIGALKERGMGAHISSNLNIRTGLAAAVRAAPDSIKVSLSGLSADTYPKSHAGGDIHLVRSNLHLLRHLLDRHRVATRVWVGFHLYRHNLHERDAVRDLCAQLGFEYRESTAVFQPIDKMMDLIHGRETAADRAAIAMLLADPLHALREVGRKRSGRYDCELRFNMTTINHDGSVALCCATYGQAAMTGRKFLDVPHAELEAARYRHDMCRSCFSHGLQYTLAEVL